MRDVAQNGPLIPIDLNSKGFRNLTDFFINNCITYADKPAVSCLGKTISYRELHHQANAFACYLQQQTDLQPGDRIAIQMPNLIQYQVVVFGALMARLVVVNTNPLYTPKELDHQFSDAAIKALVVHKSALATIEKLTYLPNIKHIIATQMADLHDFAKRYVINGVIKYVKKMEPAHGLKGVQSLASILRKYKGKTPNYVSANANDIAVLQYTGGTTGVAKGAMLSHANLVSNILQTHERLKLATDWQHTVIAPLPLYHIYAFANTQVVMYAGGHNVLIPDPRDINGFVKQLSKLQPTGFLGINTLFVALCNNRDFQQLDFSQLKFAASGGTALTIAAAGRWKKVTGTSIIEGYGMTETSPVVTLNDVGNPRLGYIGRALCHTRVMIVDEAGKPLPNGSKGELCVAGPQVMQGYWQNADATAEVFLDNGYMLTGDIAVMEPDGLVQIVDRVKDMIIVSGFNVYPNEIEDVISSHPDVMECAVVGVPDDVSGEKVKAFVVLVDDIDKNPKDLLAWCADKLTNYKIPKMVEFIDELPKSNVGKILRKELR